MEKSKTKWVLMMESLPKTWIGKVLLHSCPLHIKIDRWIQRFRYIQDQDVETSGPLWRGTDIPHFRSLYTLTSQKKSIEKLMWFLTLTLPHWNILNFSSFLSLREDFYWSKNCGKSEKARNQRTNKANTQSWHLIWE